jgi:transcriptional regulator with XRE-family HTH domain
MKQQKSIGQKIRELRERLKLSQKELGQILDVSQKRVGEMENKTKNPSAALLNRVAKALSVSITYFLEDGQQKNNVEEDSLLIKFRKLHPKNKKLVIEIMKILDGI